MPRPLSLKERDRLLAGNDLAEPKVPDDPAEHEVRLRRFEERVRTGQPLFESESEAEHDPSPLMMQEP